MELISVIVPVFNGAPYLSRCIDSVLKQTYENLQILIIDDGSEDDSLNIAREYERKDKRIRVFHQANQGVSSARNKGIQNADGDYLVFIDGDDYIADNMIETLYLDITKTPTAQVAICNYESDRTDSITDTNRREILDQEEAASRLFFRSSYQGFLCNKMFKTEIIRKHHLSLNPKITICEDLLFCFQYFMYIEKAVYNSQVLYFYTDTGTGATRTDRFNAKRYTMLDSFSEIEEFWEKHPVSEKVKRHAYNYLATVCMLLFKMTVKYSEEAGKAPMKRIFQSLKKTSWKYLFSEWQLKFKVAYVPLKIISSFRK